MSVKERQDIDIDHNLVVEPVKPGLKKPRLYRVILLNDDYTPMEFVIDILMSFFGIDQARAIKIMLQVHNLGSGTCGIYTRDIAETKVAQVSEYARSHHYPLLCTMEAE